MSNRLSQWRLLLGLVVVVFALGACSPAAPAAAPTAAKPAAAPTAAPAAAAAPTAAAAAAKPSGQPIVIGVVADRSGSAAFYSSQTADAITAAIKQINAQGGILGRPVEMRFENDTNDPNLSTSLARKLIQGGAHAILLASGTPAVMAARAALSEQKVPGIAAVAYDDRIVDGPTGTHIYLVNLTSAQSAEVEAQAMQAAGYKKIAIYKETTATVEGFLQIHRPMWEKYGATVVAEEAVPSDVTDATSQVLRIRDAKPDMVYVEAPSGRAEVAYYKKAFELGMKIPMMDAATFQNMPDLWPTVAPEAVNGLLAAGQITLTNPRTAAANDVMKAELGAKFQGFSSYMGTGWDSPFLLKKAFELAGSTDPVALKKGIESIKGYPASFGAKELTINYAADNHVGAKGQLCGFVMQRMKGNTGVETAPGYQPKC